MPAEIQFLGHSAFKISTDKGSLLIDPFISGNPEANTDISKLHVDDILLTHAHGDHLGDAIEISKQKGTQISAIFELANYCTTKGANAQGLNMGGKVKFDWGYAVWLPASHSSGTPDGQYGGEAASILINIGGVKVYHAGDTGLHYDLKMIGEFYKPDISLLPIGGFYTMGIDEAVQAVKWLETGKVIPMHYNTFPPIQTDVNEFKKKIETETNAECIILKQGELYTIY